MEKTAIINARVEALRSWMRKHGLNAYIFPSTDPHAGEYVPDHWKTREWISGFNGSAGTAVVTLTRAGLWTDSRYWLAAEEQTAGTAFTVIRCSRNVATADELTAWINADRANSGDGYADDASYTVGLDAWTNTADSVAELRKALTARKLRLVTEVEPATELWNPRPTLPETPVELQPLKYAGRSANEKLADVRAALHSNGTQATLVTQLDEIAWLLNLRGSDVHCTPVFVSYLLIMPDKAILYVNPSKLTTEVCDYLKALNIEVKAYEDVRHFGQFIEKDWTLQLDHGIVNEALCMPGSIDAPSPIPALRAVKNETEIAGFHNAMLKDGVAMVKFLRWLTTGEWTKNGGEWVMNGEKVTEITIDRKLTALRAEQEGFRDISFDTIVGYGSHAAIVHYEATPETDIPLEPHGLLLLDSGAQYQDGTTDITRTIAMGPLTDDERRDYTLVLKGHIRLAMAVFPDGTSGTQLDVLARYAMWQDHKNYGHGTGHGVGSYLSVHEGPHQFRMNWMPAPLHAGMTITIEPGIYIAGSHGCRTENTMLIVEDGNGWLRLEPLTCCPIDTTPIVRELMTKDEIDYLNTYHRHVCQALEPLLSDEKDKQWLRNATKEW